MIDLSRLPGDLQPPNFVRFDRDEIEQSIPDRFEKQVELYPKRLALKDGDISLTYQELNRASNQLAHLIIAKTNEYNGPIALLIDHGISQIITILGILKAGNSYVALDPSFPSARLAYFLKDSQAPFLIANNNNLSLADELCRSKLQIINLRCYLAREKSGRKNLCQI